MLWYKKLTILFIISLMSITSLQAETVKALFLGHSSKHHNSRKNHYLLFPEFLQRGIEMTYTEDVKDLNAATLSKYDVLILFANHEKISPQQEKDLIAFVEGGKGFVPLHCASACFGHSDKFASLVGGRFWKHGKEWFTCNHVEGKESHEVLKDVPEFETMDETYIHKDLNPDRTDLQVRIKDGHKEPWTWIRNQGKGRVFYTAYGHDGPVWEDPNYHRLVANGVIWASGKSNIKPLKDYPKFTYQPDKEGYLTNYEKRKYRHDKRQDPFPAEQSAFFNIVPEGFEAKLFAHDPDIVKAIDMAWDDQGRLFIAETIDYPNDINPEEGQGNDRITMCEDTDGDGKADKFTVFADKLSVPTSICFSDGGIIVAQAPIFLFLKDTDDDGKADVRKVLNEGWGIGDTHAGPSNLQYGLDNKIYGAIGYSGGPNKVRSGLFRMNPDGSDVENITNFNNNTWGLGISEDFEVFGSTANRNPAFHAAIPYRYYDNAGVKKKPANIIFDDNSFYPLIATRQVDAFGMYTAGAGFNLYTARTYPEKYWNKAAFIGGPSGRLLGQFFLKEDGASYKAINGQNLMASFDQYTSPIQAKTGPDGQVWVLDWSNLIIQHNPTPSLARGGFKSRNGKGNAHWNPLRDKKHGRVYRIVYKDGKPSQALDLSKADSKILVAALKNDNMFWRMTAQRKIVQEKRTDAIPFLIELAKDESADSLGLNAGVVHALWSLHGLGALNGENSEVLSVAKATLKHKSAGVRKNAVKVLPALAESSIAVVQSGILRDKDLNVRRNAFLEVSRMPGSKEVAQELIKQRNDVVKDVWLNDSLLIALSKHNEGILETLLATLPPRNKASESSVGSSSENLFPSESFEKVKNGLPEGWSKKVYNGSADFTIDSAVKHSGNNSVRISSDKGSDAGLKIFLELSAGTYKLSGWVKTEKLKKVSKAGACFNIEGDVSANVTKAIKGTKDWQLLEVTFKLNRPGKVGFNCLFGGWGGAVGTAWFDDVKLIRLKDKAAVSGYELVSKASEAYFKKYPSSVVEIIEKLTKIEESAAAAILANIPALKNVKLSSDELARLKTAAQDLSVRNRQFILKFAANNGLDLGLGTATAENAFVAEVLKGNAQRGQALSATCIGCHGTDLNGDDGRKSPALAAQNDWYIITQMQKYKHGVRGADVSDVNAMAMKDISDKLNSQQMADIAAYIKSNFKGKKHKISLGGDPVKGKQLYVACVACHGTEGQGNPQIKSPKLTGLQDWYIFESLKKFKSKERGNGEGDMQGKLMQTSVMMLQDEQAMKDVAAYLSTLEP